MTTPYANILPAPRSDGLLLANLFRMPAAEGVLFNVPIPPNVSPTPVIFQQSALAIVKFTTSGSITSNTTYIVMQTDLGDDVWVDMCWAIWTGTAGPAIFVFSNGVADANSFQQTRAVGSAPSTALGSNQMTLGGRIRFVGKSTVAGGSASS